MRHAGVEEHRFSDRPGYNVTLCGRRVAPKLAPYSQPISDITCKLCQRTIMAAWENAIKERAGKEEGK